MRNNSRASVNLVMLCIIATFVGGGTFGLGTVWTRHQISRTAESNRDLKLSIQRIERQIAETTALVEGAQSPAELRHRNAEFKLGFQPVAEMQVVHDRQDADTRLLVMRTRANQELLKEGLLRDAAETPAPIVFKIAQH